MVGYLGRRGISLLRPVVLAAFGAVAWLLWLAGPSQATDALPTIPAVPTAPAVLTVPTIPLPAVSLPHVPLPAPIGQLVPGISTVIPTVTPVVEGLTDTVKSVNIVPPLPELPLLPELPSVPELPALPPVSAVLPLPRELGIPAATAPLPPRSDVGTLAPTAPTTLIGMGALSPAVRTAQGASTGIRGFIPDKLVLMPPAELAIAGTSNSSGEPSPDKPLPSTAFQPGAGSTSGPEGGSAFGAADLPEQRALAPPPRHGPIPDRRQCPSAEPAFDPGSSPD